MVNVFSTLLLWTFDYNHVAFAIMCITVLILHKVNFSCANELFSAYPIIQLINQFVNKHLLLYIRLVKLQAYRFYLYIKIQLYL